MNNTSPLALPIPKTEAFLCPHCYYYSTMQYKEVQFADDKKYKIVVKNETEVKSYNAKVLISDKTNDLAFVSIIDRDFKGVDFIPYSLYFTLHPRQLPVQARRAMGTRKSCASASANKWSVTEFACTARRRQDWQYRNIVEMLKGEQDA